MGNDEVFEIGGSGLLGLVVVVMSVSALCDFSSKVTPEEVVSTVFLVWDDVDGGRPEIVGGGRSSPSAALRVSCRAKSEACHHSRNFKAKMEVGRRILRLDRSRG